MMTPRTVAIMQPTYLPWIGYFDLIDQVDCFVFLDSVQFERRSWQQRNRVKAPDRTLWLSVPVLSKGKREQRIADVEIDLNTNFHQNHLKTIDHIYGKAPYYQQYIGDLSALLCQSHRQLSDLNIDLIGLLCGSLGIKTDIARSSSLDVGGNKTALLVDICKTLGASRYISVEGSRGYIEENDLFASNAIQLDYQAFLHPEYRQLYGDFVPYLSVLDLLFNEGPDSLSIVRSGRAGA